MPRHPPVPPVARNVLLSAVQGLSPKDKVYGRTAQRFRDDLAAGGTSRAPGPRLPPPTQVDVHRLQPEGGRPRDGPDGVGRAQGPEDHRRLQGPRFADRDPSARAVRGVPRFRGAHRWREGQAYRTEIRKKHLWRPAGPRFRGGKGLRRHPVPPSTPKSADRSPGRGCVGAWPRGSTSEGQCWSEPKTSVGRERQWSWLDARPPGRHSRGGRPSRPCIPAFPSRSGPGATWRRTEVSDRPFGPV